MPASKSIDMATALNKRGIAKEFKAVIRSAYEQGWHGRTKSSGGIEIISPDNTVRLYVPTGSRNNGDVARTLTSRLGRWGAAQTAQTEGLKVAENAFDDVDFTMGVAGGDSTTAKCNEHNVEFASWDALSAHVRKEHPIDPAVPELPVVELKFDPPEEDLELPMSRTMSTEEVRKPWLAQGAALGSGDVQVYESATTTEVTLNGEVVRYECSLEGCEYASGNPRSVSTHYGKAHVSTGQVPPVAPPAVVGTRKFEPKYAEGKRLRDGIGADIYQAMRARARHKGESDTRYSAALAEIIVSARIAAGQEVEWKVTPEENSVLDQIRDLLGASQSQAEVEALRAELDAAQAAQVDAEISAETARSEAKKARETLRMMAELATEESSEQE